MFMRKILLALATTAPCIGRTSVIISEDDGSSSFGSFTGRTSQGGTLVPRLSSDYQIVTQVGSSNGQATPPYVTPSTPVIVSWQVSNTPANNVLTDGPDASTDPNAALIRIGDSAPSVIYPAIAAPSPLLRQIAPVDFQIRLEPSPIPESATALLWAIGALGILLASRRNAIQAHS
jgi:hypothetical protein